MKRFIILPILMFGLLSATAQQSITLLQPAAGVSWEGATTHAITWQAQNVNMLTIAFSANGGVTWQTIQEAYPASAQSYQWPVPAQPTTTARIRLSDSDNQAMQTVSGLFTIPDSFITLVQPENLTAGNACAIRWQSSCIFNLNILLSSDGGNNWTSLYTNISAPFGIKNWPLPAAGTYQLKLEDAANPAMVAVSEPFVIAQVPFINPAKYHGGSFDGYASKSNLPDLLQITFPAGGETLEGSTVQNIRWERQNTSLLMILLSLDGGLTWNDTLQELYPAEALSYAWTVPNIPTQEGRIRLVSLDSPGLETESENFVIPEPFVEITNSFVQLYNGTPYPVFWTSSSVAAVNLAFSADGGATWQSFAENVPALRGIKNWTVPDVTTQGKIRIWDASNPDLFDETEEFVITSLPPHNPVKYHGGSFDGYASYSNQPPALTLLFPAGGETLEGSSVQTLQWDRQNTSRMMILFSSDGGATWSDTIQKLYPAEALSNAWTVPNIPTTTGRIRLVSVDVPGLESQSGDFVIPEPFIEITNSFSQLFAGTPYPVFWNSASVSAVSLAFSPDGGTNWQTIAENVPALRKIKNWAVPEPTTQGKIKIWNTENPDLYDETGIFVINSLPEHNPTKYHGGSYDGYASYAFKAADFACPPDTVLCMNEPAFEIAGGTPTGGIFSGAGITGAVFDPLAAGVGTHEITYQYTYFNGSSTECTFHFTVLPVPEVACQGDISVCLNQEAFPLSGATPTGGFYAGAGVTNGIFDPATAGVGSHLIHYSYTSPEGCTNTCTFTITVNALPVMVCPENMDVCEDVPQLALPAAFPEGGTYSGATVENGWFYPSVAGVGVHEISYSFTDENGCSNGCQFQVTVHPLPEMTCPADFGVCVDAGLIGLPQALPLGGTYSGNGVEGTLFNPALAGVGLHPITYQFTDSEGCTNACGFEITVNPLPVLTCPQDVEFCISDEPVALVGALPLGGTFTGTGIAAGVFSPAVAGLGLHPVVYSYTDPNGCFNTCNFTIQVHPLPILTCLSDKIVCVSSAPFALTEALPSGGIYSGQGVVNGTFNPQLAGTGSHAIVYTFTDENTCTAACSFTIIVKPLPVVSCPGNFAVCQNDAPFLLTGGNPAGGVYSGIGVSGGMFYPGNVTTGVKNITYTFQDQFGCANSCLFKISVLPVPVITCPGNMEVCLNEPPFEIVGLSPIDGELTGPGINGTVFNPLMAGVGNHEITYNFTSPVNFCSNFCTFTITVLPLPELSCGANLTFCLNDDPMVLNVATPVGGTYSGTGVEQGIFYPDLAGVGVHEMMYTYTSPENGCTHTCSFAAIVLELPEMTCIPDFSVCLNEEPFLLDQAAPFGGTYTGTGVEENVFNPSVAGVGMHEIMYVYTSPVTLCNNSCSFFIDVLPLPELTCGLPLEVCYNDQPLVLDFASPAGGNYSGAGVENGVFYPESAGVGSHEIVYSFSSPENSCTNTCTFTITVKPLPTLTCGADLEICLNEAPLMLENALPGGGFYSGTGIEGGVFDPLAAGVGTHDIFYQFTGENGCSSACQFQITVLPVPEMSCPENIGICVYENPFVLNMATPPGGVYAGEGVEGNLFNPATAGVGEHAVEYIFANEFGCSESCSFIISVYPVSEIICDFPQQVCLYDGPIALTDCTPGGGTYQGTGVAGNTFFPEIAGVGEHEITYFFVHPETGCENQISFDLNVLPAQWVELPGGWTGISSYMIPVNLEIPEIFADLGNKLEILYNLDGTIYYPAGGLIPQNTWDTYSGYCLKTNQAVAMEFCGEYLQNLTVPLSQGWNLIPMLSKDLVSSEYLFGFNNEVKIVKQVAGWKLYWKEMGINTLGFVKPGEAYYVYCTGETSVTFPYYFKDGGEQSTEEEPVISPFEVVNPTPATHILAFADLKTLPFSKGDVIAAFASSGLCAGQVQVGFENPGLVMFGDDTYSELQDGLISGEKITYRLYRPDNNRLFDLDFSYDTKYQVGDYFQPEGISVVKEVKMSAVGLETTQADAVNIFPNPTTGILNITGIEGSYEVEIYNVVQETILTKTLFGHGQIDLSEFSKGVYLVKVVFGVSVVTRKVTKN